jgi:hypothetical protein
MTFLGATTPFYGGGQVKNPANVIPTTGSPSTNLKVKLGTLAVDNAAGAIYGAASLLGGVTTWVPLGGGTSVLSTLTGNTGGALTPTAGNINIVGTSNQMSFAGATSTLTGSLSSTLVAPGSITATTTLTATLGNITATNGNLVLGTAGNKLAIATGSNASVGVTAAMSGTPGAVTVMSTAVTTSSVISYSRATTGGTPGQVSITAQSTGSFTLTSTGNETSTFNYLIIN